MADQHDADEMVSRTELEAVLARLAAVEAELAAARGGSPATTDGVVDPSPSGAPAVSTADEGDVATRGPVDRRSLLRGGSLVAGAVAGGAVGALLNASPAAAAQVSGSSAVSDGVVGDTTAAGFAGTAGSSATIGAFGVRGVHFNGGVAVRGTSQGNTNGIGVQGVADVGGGTGVVGTTSGADGVGMKASATGVGGYGIKADGQFQGVYGFSGNGTGVGGETNTGETAVFGNNNSTGVGVGGLSTGGTGVMGITNGTTAGVAGVSGYASNINAVGLLALNTAGIALRVDTNAASSPGAKITATSGPAVDAFSTTGYGAALTGGGATTGANLRLVPTGVAAPSRTGTHLRGELAEDTAGNLWLCTADGAPGTWRKLAGPATSGALHALPTPVRIYDSRTAGSGGIMTDTTRTIDAKVKDGGGSSGIAAGTLALLVNLAVTDTNSGGYGALWASGPWPGNASVNWGLPNLTTSNGTLTALSPTATFLCKIAGTANVIIDVVGYYL